jgi:hypothetical protein
MIVNLAALALVAVARLFRDWRVLSPSWVAIVLDIGALGLVSVGGWLGGTLAYRNQIGVDRRYADAGKWNEVSVEGSPGESRSAHIAQS